MGLKKKKRKIVDNIEEVVDGHILISKDDFFMNNSKNLFLIKDKKYVIKDSFSDKIIIQSEFSKNHNFNRNKIDRFFKLN